MGFFSDLKEDLSQAVNELMPDEKLEDVKKEKVEETVSLDEMLQNIDSIQIPEEDGDSGKAESPEQDANASAAAFVTDGAAVSKPDEEPEKTGLEEEGLYLNQEATENAMSDPLPEMAEKEEMTAETPVDEAEPAFTEEAILAEAAATEQKPAPDWDLESMLENALTEKTAQTTEKTDVYKGAGMTMEMSTERVAVDETSVITGGMTMTGDIMSEGSLDIIGTINGNIDIMGKLNITGHIDGNSKAAEIYAEGAKINGEVVSEGAVKIGASTVIVGNITASSAAIAGAVKGDIDVKGPVILDASAIVMGNIKSKSVQINNGAVIEGMCSQCYADVNPTSFFEDYKMETQKGKTNKGNK